MEKLVVNNNRHNHFKLKICVSGSAEMGNLPPRDHEIAKELGREIARHGAALVTGATTGFPFWTAMGAKEENGMSVGFSPASSEKEHVQVYKLPIDYMDFMIYTGFGYPGRDLFLTKSADGVIVGPGRIGTFHEFTIAFEDGKPIGILQSDDWTTDNIIAEIIENSHTAKRDNIIYDKDPKKLVEKVIEAIKKQKINDSNLGNPFLEKSEVK